MPRILVVEDEAPIRENLRSFLMLEGHEVLEAPDGAAGLQAVRTQRPDLVLCDVMMPEMSGFEMLQQLRRDASLAAIPVIFLTASAEPEYAARGLELGAVACVTKPFELAALAGLIRQWLGEPRN